MYQFIKPLLDNKMSILEEFGAFKSRYAEATIFPALTAMFCCRNLVVLLNREGIVFVPFEEYGAFKNGNTMYIHFISVTNILSMR